MKMTTSPPQPVPKISLKFPLSDALKISPFPSLLALLCPVYVSFSSQRDHIKLLIRVPNKSTKD